jgi:hypothetical protein
MKKNIPKMKRKNKMNNEFIEYMEAKIAENNPDGFDETLLSLYEKGLIEVEMKDGEPMIQVSPKGTESFMNELALSFVDTVEA